MRTFPTEWIAIWSEILRVISKLMKKMQFRTQNSAIRE